MPETVSNQDTHLVFCPAFAPAKGTEKVCLFAGKQAGSSCGKNKSPRFFCKDICLPSLFEAAVAGRSSYPFSPLQARPLFVFMETKGGRAGDEGGTNRVRSGNKGARGRPQRICSRERSTGDRILYPQSLLRRPACKETTAGFGHLHTAYLRWFFKSCTMVRSITLA